MRRIGDVIPRVLEGVRPSGLPGDEVEVCDVCGGAGWVLTPQRELRPCPNGCGFDALQKSVSGLLSLTEPRRGPSLTFEALQNPHPKVREVVDVLRGAVEGRLPLFALISGPYGVGKTHLLMATVNLARARRMTALYGTVGDLARRFRQEAGPEGRLDAIREALRVVEVLALDEVGREYETEFIRDELFSALNGRYESGLITVLATNAPIDELPGYLVSRARDVEVGFVADLSGVPDYRAIRRRK